MLVNEINSLVGDSRKAISNYRYDRFISMYSTFIKEKYRDNLYEEISFGDLLEDNEQVIEEFIENVIGEDFRREQNGVNSGLSSLVAFYKYLNKRNVIDSKQLVIAVKTISKYKLKVKKLKKEEKCLQITDIHHIVSHSKSWFSHVEKFAPGKSDPLRFKMMLYFVFYTGIRRVELEALKRSDFNLGECSVKIKDRMCYYPDKVRDMIKQYFDSEQEVKNAFNFTNAIAGRFNRILSRYKFQGRRLNISFLRDSNANMIMNRTRNVGVLMKLHGEVNKCYINKYTISDKDVASIYKRNIHYQERSKK